MLVIFVLDHLGPLAAKRIVDEIMLTTDTAILFDPFNEQPARLGNSVTKQDRHDAGSISMFEGVVAHPVDQLVFVATAFKPIKMRFRHDVQRGNGQKWRCQQDKDCKRTEHPLSSPGLNCSEANRLRDVVVARGRIGVHGASSSSHRS